VESGEGRGRNREVGGPIRNWGGRRGRGDARNIELSILLLTNEMEHTEREERF
jgi:hypothetical protein